MKTQTKHNFRSQWLLYPKKGLIALFLMCCCSLFAQNNSRMAKNDDELINQYVKSKGAGTISFDASNIKQFWIDNSVRSENNNIYITLKTINAKKYESVPMRLTLINVIETQNCTIDIITENKDLSFAVSNAKSKVLSQSSSKEDFINYHVVSTTFPLEDSDSFSFNLIFSSPQSEQISIKSIVLSFSDNPNSSFSGSPGFNNLLKLFDEKGVAVSNSDIQYLISENNNVIYIRIPADIASSKKYLYHVYPANKSELVKPNTSFNNLDSKMNNEKKMIPKPYFCESKYSILQCPLPSYEFTQLLIGQFDETGNIWILKLQSKDID